MYDPNSPIIDFYPLEFEQDLNGKKQDWEAIVKIPFIDEVRLLNAMAGVLIFFLFALSLSYLIFPSQHVNIVLQRKSNNEIRGERVRNSGLIQAKRHFIHHHYRVSSLPFIDVLV